MEFVDRMDCVPRILASRNAKLGSPVREQDLPDLVQDTLIVIWRKLPSFQGRASLETWVYRICCLELMNFVRRRRRAQREQGRDEEVVEREDTQASSAFDESFDDLYQALERVPESEERVIWLKHFEELTFESIGHQLGISENTAKTRYYRGLRRMQGMLRATRAEDARPEEIRR